jgi:uncharacterized protein YjdB
MALTVKSESTHKSIFMFKIIFRFFASTIKLVVTSIMLLTGAGFMAQESFAQGGGDLMDVLPVTDRILMIHIRDGHIDTYGIGQNISHNRVYHSPTSIERATTPANYSITGTGDDNYSSPLNPLNIGRKSKGWEYQDAWNPPPYIWQHWIYIELPHEMQQGQTYTVHLDNITGNRNSFTLEFDVNSIRSETVRVNMVGFPENGPKFAYLSHWMGDFSTGGHPDGGLNLDDKTGNEFRVIDFATGETAFTGTIAKRMGKNTRETVSTDFPSGNYTNADVWQCDFSGLTTPGEYIVAVDGIGRSFPFEIGNDITREAYYFAMKGLFWQRQGIAVEIEPDSIRPRGHHPDDIVWRFDPEWHGQGYDTSGFNTGSPQVHGVWGHYYDAGDWDGYVTHNRVPAHLLLLYDLAPEGFNDGDVGNRYKLHEDGEWIDEGKSGKPDLLDEAVWLLDYNRRARHILMDFGGTGGVPGYVGRDGIPSGNSITAWMDTREWFISGNNPEATFLYSGNAAYYAINLNRFHKLKGEEGSHPEYDEWMTEAIESWQWAEANYEATNDTRRARGYAAAVLYRATADPGYQDVFKAYWEWEPSKTEGEWAGVNLWAIAAMQHALLPGDHAGLDTDLQTSCRNNIIARADSKSGDIFSNGFRNGMEYYQFIQLGGFNTSRLTVLGAAHRLTGDSKYLGAMQHAVSYVLGGNQLNMTYLSGLGERSDQWVFQPNAYLVSNKNSMVYTPENYIGQTSYFGATGLASGYWFTQSKFAEYWSRQAAHPPAADPPSVWPGAEQKFQNRYSIQGGEFTIHQQMNHMIFAMGYINAMAETSDAPYSPAPRPEVSLNLTDGQEFEPGSWLTAEASDNTRNVKYYYNWRYIGESSDRENNFRLAWAPDLNDGTNVLITAVAYSDRGRRSLSTSGGEKNIIITLDKSVTGVSMSETTLTLLAEESQTLVATVEPDYAENTGVSWESSDITVATVDGQGVVTGVGEGTAVITVTTDEGGFMAECQVTVTSPVSVTDKDPSRSLEPVVFPNPFGGGELVIETGNIGTGETVISIYNSAGTAVFTRKGYPENGKIIIAPHLTTGAYIMKIEIDKKTFTRMLLAE